MNITKMSELLEAYREFLDETTKPMNVAGGGVFTASYVVENLDPIAFRCGYLEYADAEGIDIDTLEGDL